MRLKQLNELRRMNPLPLLGEQPGHGLFPFFQRWDFDRGQAGAGFADDDPFQVDVAVVGEDAQLHVGHRALILAAEDQALHATHGLGNGHRRTGRHDLLGRGESRPHPLPLSAPADHDHG